MDGHTKNSKFMCKYLLIFFSLITVIGCNNNWGAADYQFKNFYHLKIGQVYEITKKVYVSPNGKGTTKKEHSNLNYVVLLPGTKFVAVRVEEFGSYNNGYHYRPFGKVLAPSAHKGLEFNFAKWLSDNSGNIYKNEYVRRCE